MSDFREATVKWMIICCRTLWGHHRSAMEVCQIQGENSFSSSNYNPGMKQSSIISCLRQISLVLKQKWGKGPRGSRFSEVFVVPLLLPHRTVNKSMAQIAEKIKVLNKKSLYIYIFNSSLLQLVIPAFDDLTVCCVAAREPAYK